jgi:hypothetical protein
MKIVVLVFALVSILGCAAIAIKPGAEKVRVTKTEPGKECTFLGEATGSQGNFLTGDFTSNSNLETGARNDLKNKAAAMGGNVVFILTDRAGQTGGYQSGGSQTNVVITGNVYSCPEY